MGKDPRSNESNDRRCFDKILISKVSVMFRILAKNEEKECIASHNVSLIEIPIRFLSDVKNGDAKRGDFNLSKQAQICMHAHARAHQH